MCCNDKPFCRYDTLTTEDTVYNLVSDSGLFFIPILGVTCEETIIMKNAVNFPS